MPSKRKKRPNEGYRVYRNLPGFGRVGPWQTGLVRKSDAKRVEAWLLEMALLRPHVVEGIVDGRYRLIEVWAARQQGRLEQFLKDNGIVRVRVSD